VRKAWQPGRAGRVCPGFLRPIQSFGTALEKLLPETPRAAKLGNGNAPVKTLLSGSYVLLTVPTHPPHRFWSTMTALFLVNDAFASPPRTALSSPPIPRCGWDTYARLASPVRLYLKGRECTP